LIVNRDSEGNIFTVLEDDMSKLQKAKKKKERNKIKYQPQFVTLRFKIL